MGVKGGVLGLNPKPLHPAVALVLFYFKIRAKLSRLSLNLAVLSACQSTGIIGVCHTVVSRDACLRGKSGREGRDREVWVLGDESLC